VTHEVRALSAVRSVSLDDGLVARAVGDVLPLVLTEGT
jgi:hypothetical protein